MLTYRFANKVAIRMLIIACILITLLVFSIYATETDRPWLLVVLPFVCTIPPSLRNIHPREMMIDHGRTKGVATVLGKTIPRIFVMNSVVYGGATTIVALVVAYSSAVCFFSGGAGCLATYPY